MANLKTFSIEDLAEFFVNEIVRARRFGPLPGYDEDLWDEAQSRTDREEFVRLVKSEFDAEGLEWSADQPFTAEPKE